MPDRVETTITTTIQLVILNLNGFSYIQWTLNVFGEVNQNVWAH